MNTTSERALVAVFTDRESALSVLDVLKSHGFTAPWLATTRPAPVEAPGDPRPAPAPVSSGTSENEVADSSDGIMGTIGRFFSGEGNSLRRSLEDHGVDPVDAAEIDATLPPAAAVVTVFGGARPELAAKVLRDGGGRLSETLAFETDPLAAVPGPVAEPGALGRDAYDPGAYDPGALPGPLGEPGIVPREGTTTTRQLVDTVPVPGMPGAYEEVFVERKLVMPAGAGHTPVTGSRGNDELNDLL
jgi:hypothetical protein